MNSTIQYEAVEFMGEMLSNIRKNMSLGTVFENTEEYEKLAWFRLLLSVSKYIDIIHEKQRTDLPPHQIPFNIKKWKTSIEEDLECAMYTFSPYHDFLVSGEIRNGISNLLWRVRECIQYCDRFTENDWNEIVELVIQFQGDDLGVLRYSTRNIQPHIQKWNKLVTAWTEFLKIYDSVYNEIFTDPIKIIQDMSMLFPDFFWFQFWLNMLSLEKNLPSRNFRPREEITEFQDKLIHFLGPHNKACFPEKCTKALQEIANMCHSSSSQRIDFLMRAEQYESSILARSILGIELIPHPTLIHEETQTSGMVHTAIQRGINDVMFRGER